ncbi:MAG: acid--CoA ligase [Candidatus Aminicenantales bacterium]
MRIIDFLTDNSVVDRIISRLKLSFVAERPPPLQVAFEELLMAAQSTGKYLS